MSDVMLAMIYHRMWYALPLLVATSLVYGATRHERLYPILNQSWRFFVWLILFMGVLYFVVWLFSRGL
jgi:hypothetical protein